MNLTVCCVYVKGEYPYDERYVKNLRWMVERWIDRPFRFVCLTDQPWLFSDIETIPVQKLQAPQAYWTKLELFNPIRQWHGRVLYLDLDVLIVSPLAPIIDYPAQFALTADPAYVGSKTVDRFKRKIVRRFNSSVMVWDGGTQTHLFEMYSPKLAERLSGDQDAIAELCPDAVGMPRSWFPRLSEVTGPPFAPEVKVVLTKFPKNHVAVEQFDWFAPLWGAA